MTCDYIDNESAFIIKVLQVSIANKLLSLNESVPKSFRMNDSISELAIRSKDALDRRPTIYDIAKKADVSISTVSRVFNNSASVSIKTKISVE